MSKKANFQDVKSVLHADLIGKDSHRGITLTYGWMANQLGHFALGFIPSCALVVVYGQHPLDALLYVGLFWLLFEIYNALSPLYKKEYKGNGSFRPQWGNLTFDTFTDLCFFWLGSFAYYLFNDSGTTQWLVLAALLLYLAFGTRYWFLTKLYQQNAFLPYQFRLSQWDGEISSKNKERIQWFLSNGHQPHHFLVYGGKGRGKTRLMVGVANELAIRHFRSTYTTLAKWVSLLQESNDELAQSKHALWAWTDASFLLIDDINPGSPSDANKYSSADIAAYVCQQHEERNKRALRNMSVAWVVGSNREGDSVEQWKDLLRSFGLDEDQIHVLDLND